MERTEFLQKLHELKTKQYEDAYQFKNNNLDRQKKEAEELESENNMYEFLKKQHQNKLKEIKEKWQRINHSEKQGHSIMQHNFEEKIANLKIEFFAEHPEEQLSILRS